jgi:hypothetical protein
VHCFLQYLVSGKVQAEPVVAPVLVLDGWDHLS